MTSLLAVIVLALFAAPCAAAAQVKTTDTRWSFRVPLPSGVSGAEMLAFDGKG